MFKGEKQWMIEAISGVEVPSLGRTRSTDPGVPVEPPAALAIICKAPKTCEAEVDSNKPLSARTGAPTFWTVRPAVAGIKDKSEFPAGWSDDKIIREVESVANDSASTRTVQPNGRIRVEGARDGVDIRVIIDADNTSIWTAHPTNMPRNL